MVRQKYKESDKLKWSTVSLKKEHLAFIQKLKREKGFHSLSELIYNCCKCVELYSKPQIITLANIKVLTEAEFTGMIKAIPIKIERLAKGAD